MSRDRLFVAIDLSAEARAQLTTLLAPHSPLPGRPGDPVNWHITLRFLGASTPEQLDRVLGGLDELPHPFSVHLGGVGAFPRLSKASVLWLGVGAPPEMASLAARAEEAAMAAGFRPEERPFHAHVTLSRLRPPRDLRSLADRLPHFKVKMPVTELTVFRSILGTETRYETVERVALG